MLKTVIIYAIILFIFIIIARIISYYARPVIKDTKPNFDNFTDYMTSVYCPNSNCGKNILPFPRSLIVYNDSFDMLSSYSEPENKIDDKNIDIEDTLRYFNYIYDNAPRCILDNYPIAENLSFSWPPPLGSRYKLTAFPYPKSDFILSAVYDTISNTVDAYTFPAWIIQRRNPLDFNNSIYNNNYFRDYQDIEVVHACYPPPGAKYPYCDDGGYWLYLATGSGVFWNTGKCIVSLNKLSLLYDLYKCSTKTRREISLINEKTGKNLPLTPIVGLSIDDMVDKLKDKLGGKSIMLAIFNIVESLLKHKFTAKVIGFKNMTSSNSGKPSWNNFVSRTFLIIFLIVVTFIQFFINIKNKNYKEIIGLILLCLIIITILLYIFFFIVFEDFFRGLGWMTLQMALDKTNMTLYQFVEECVTGNLKNPICNSLAMTQIFDLETEIYSYTLGYDSFILTSQPNKTGSWEVEICDLRKFDKNKLLIKGGVCGTYHQDNSLDEPTKFDVCDNKLLPPIKSTILKAGPIEIDSSGPPFYKPTKECDCVENSKRLCTSCNGYLSQKMCINK